MFVTCLDFLIHVDVRTSAFRRTRWACDSQDCYAVARRYSPVASGKSCPGICQITKPTGIQTRLVMLGGTAGVAVGVVLTFGAGASVGNHVNTVNVKHMI